MINEKIIPALDVQDENKLTFLLSELKEAQILKVGMELYYTFGNNIVKQLKEYQYKIFLDLKLHDIPNTVARSCKKLGSLGADILNVHAAGGIDMMRAANEAFKSEHQQGMLIGVTQLTSTSQTTMNQELLIEGNSLDVVLHYAENVKKAGLDGVVCSGHEVREIKKRFGESFKCITPGIRPEGDKSHDQKRVMTPRQAIEVGSDYLVIGRSIYQADSPKSAFKAILEEIK